MRRGVFVTGTDTGVGKTVVCAALLHRFRRYNSVRYWKPIQTGIEQDDDSAEVSRLTGGRPGETLNEGVRLERPVSPHLAARWAGVTIDLDPLVDRVLVHDAGQWIVEGAGGALVPINATDTMMDLMTRLGLPVVVAARTTLGTINHTLLTLDALRRRALPVAGVVLVGEPNADNREAIEQYGAVAVVGEMPRLDPLDAASLGAWADSALDPEGRLQEHFG